MPRWLAFALFLTVVLSILAGVHYFLWVRLVRNPAWPAPWRTIGTVAAFVLGIGAPAVLILVRFVPRPVGSVLAWPAFIWFGTMFLLFLALLAGDLVRLALWLGERLGGGGPADPERRRQLARVVAGAAGAIGAAAAVFAVRTGLERVRIKSLDIPIGRLPAAADGTTIVQITDLHVGPTIGRAFMQDVVDRVNALAPDIVAITGDLVDGTVAELRDGVAPLADLRARRGVYFVTGNHEYYSPTEAWLAHLPTLGIRVLRNERVPIGDGEASFDLAGIDDWTAPQSHLPGHAPDLPRALAGRDASRALVLLAHQPKAIAEAAALGVDLQLSGHTHAGQIWPFTLLVRLVQPYVAGLHRHGDTWIYVSPGTGYWGPPMRIATHPEITRLVLRRGQPA